MSNQVILLLTYQQINFTPIKIAVRLSSQTPAESEMTAYSKAIYTNFCHIKFVECKTSLSHLTPLLSYQCSERSLVKIVFLNRPFSTTERYNHTRLPTTLSRSGTTPHFPLTFQYLLKQHKLYEDISLFNLSFTSHDKQIYLLAIHYSSY